LVEVAIIFYSRDGNTLKLARAAAEGVEQVPDTKASLRRIRETAPESVVSADERWRRTSEELTSIPEATLEDLERADAVVFGSPTRFGNMCAQLKEFIDRTTSVWLEGKLIGKVGAAFTSTSTLHGGQESTILSMYNPMIHHGMIIVGVPYSETRLFNMEIGGGSPYGPSSVSGPEADRPPTENDLAIARTLGKRVAEIARKLKS